MKSRFIAFLKIALIAILAIAMVATLVLICCITPINVAYDEGIDFGILRENKQPCIYNSDDKIVSLFTNAEGSLKSHGYIDLENLPDKVIYAFIANRDRNFFNNRILNIFGDTISKQVVRSIAGNDVNNFTITGYTSLVEENVTQNEILEYYLNTQVFGSITGISDASTYFFAKPVTDISVAQAATLSSMLDISYVGDAPTKELLSLKDKVLDAMFKQGYIESEEELKNAKEEVITFETKNEIAQSQYLDLALAEAITMVSRYFGITEDEARDKLNSINSKIYTNFDKSLQDEVYNRLIAESEKYDSPVEMSFISTTSNGHIQAAAYTTNRNNSEKICSTTFAANSAFEPFIYAKAFEYGIYRPDSNIGSMEQQSPANNYESVKTITKFYYDETDGKYKYGNVPVSQDQIPEKSEPTNVGNMQIKDALKSTGRTCNTGLLDEIGIKNIIESLKSIGIQVDEKFTGAEIALGNVDNTSLFNLAEAYNTLCNNGSHTDISFVRMIHVDGIIIKGNSQNYAFSNDTSNIVKSCLKQNTDISGHQTYTKIDKGSNTLVCGLTDDITAILWIGSNMTSNEKETWANLVEAHY